jgi:hypothetical protein
MAIVMGVTIFQEGWKPEDMGTIDGVVYGPPAQGKLVKSDDNKGAAVGSLEEQAPLVDPNKIEAQLFARFPWPHGRLLAPGLWLVMRRAEVKPDGTVTGRVVAVEDMPPHWQQQIAHWQRVGDEQLGYDWHG